MSANKSGKQAIINILNGIYSEIHNIENDIGIRVDDKDLRPRIEYFHDAVRALTSGATGNKRLSIEFLAYDISMLRFIQANPVARTKGAKLNLSPSTGLISGRESEYIYGNSSANIKSRLAELYKNYSVLFAALLSESADRDYQSKVNEFNYEVENIAVLEDAAKKMRRKSDAEINIESLIEQNIDDPDIARKLFSVIAGRKKKILAEEVMKKASEMIKATDKQIKTIEKAHFTYVTSQLAIYENAKEVVKKMAVSGMNIVGNFVENAVSEATRGGRGI